MGHESDGDVGIRELRQYLSRYLIRVANGETLRVTDRGRPVAILAPLPEEDSPIGRLAREGRLVARARLDLAQLGSPPKRRTRVGISEALAEQRAEPSG